jgi:hypothetical protein
LGILSTQYARPHTKFLTLPPNEISIVALVGQEHFGCRSVCVHDRLIALEVGDFTAGEGDRYGQAHRIDAEMDLGREATF